MSHISALSLLAFTGLLLLSPLQAAETQVIKGLHRNNLIEYTKEGRKLGPLENISSEQIAGTRVLDRTPRGLVKVEFMNREMWLRESALKLSMPVTPVCPEEAPGQSADRTTPTASGMGVSCKHAHGNSQ